MEAAHDRGGRADLPEGIEEQAQRLLDLLVRIEYHGITGIVSEPDRQAHLQLATARLVALTADAVAP